MNIYLWARQYAEYWGNRHNKRSIIVFTFIELSEIDTHRAIADLFVFEQIGKKESLLGTFSPCRYHTVGRQYILAVNKMTFLPLARWSSLPKFLAC